MGSAEYNSIAEGEPNHPSDGRIPTFFVTGVRDVVGLLYGAISLKGDSDLNLSDTLRVVCRSLKEHKAVATGLVRNMFQYTLTKFMIKAHSSSPSCIKRSLHPSGCPELTVSTS